MARPIKTTVDWYKFFHGFPSSHKMKALRHHYKNRGAIILIYIWDYLLGQNNQLTPYNEETLDLWSINFDEDVEFIKIVVDCCVKYKLLQLDKFNNIFSEDLNELLAPLKEKRKKDRERPSDNSRGDNDGSRGDNDSFRGDKGSFRNPKSRVEKSRGESSSSTSSSAHARGDLGFEKEEPITVKDAAVILLRDDSWLSSMGRRHKMSVELVKKWYGSFVVECNCRGTQVHTGISDVQKHFNDWLLKQSKTTSGQKDGNRKKKALPSSSDDIIPEQVWNSCKEDLCLRVDEDTRAKTFSKMTFMSFNKEDKRLLLQIPSDEVRKCVEGDQNLFSLFSSSLKTFFGQDMKLNYYLPPKNENI